MADILCRYSIFYLGLCFLLSFFLALYLSARRDLWKWQQARKNFQHISQRKRHASCSYKISYLSFPFSHSFSMCFSSPFDLFIFLSPFPFRFLRFFSSSAFSRRIKIIKTRMLVGFTIVQCMHGKQEKKQPHARPSQISSFA